MNWVFPQLATYVVLGVGAILLARVVFGAAIKRLPDTVQWEPEDRAVAIDLVVFCAIVLAYVFVMYRLGFWLSSFLMLSLASIYLTLDKSRRSIGVAIVASIGTCIVAYIVFLHVFYVPLPEGRWWEGFG
jgi:lipopolysaccharide export LptBFGC system permease protein LptF